MSYDEFLERIRSLGYSVKQFADFLGIKITSTYMYSVRGVPSFVIQIVKILERQKLAQESRIKALETIIYEAGTGLLEVRDGELHKLRGRVTFKDYCKKMWGIDKDTVCKLIDSAKMIEASRNAKVIEDFRNNVDDFIQTEEKLKECREGKDD